jgi:hypothetical protein
LLLPQVLVALLLRETQSVSAAAPAASRG